MGARNWTYLSARKVAFAKAFYDACGAVAALVFAFLTRIALLHFDRSIPAPPSNIGEIYLNFFIHNLAPFLALVMGSLALLGFYRVYPKSSDPWKPLMILSGVSLGPGLWALYVYFTLDYSGRIPQPLFPRGVALLAWIYLLGILGAPRIVKYFLLSRMVVEVHHHRKKAVQGVLVIGGAGYIGSQLVRDLISKNYRVRVLDTFVFGESSLKDLAGHRLLDLMPGDFRNVETVVMAIRGMDAVVHLGGIVGDPACSIDDDLTIDTNLTATILLAELCKVFQIERFVFASSCSVYGASSRNLLGETSPLNPVSLYARTKIASEKVLLDLTGPNFAPTILRFATLFGLSNRPRFDLFVNLATAQAFHDKRITVFGGDQWRPFVHVRDIARAIVAVLEAPVQKVRGEIFNVGAADNCRTIAEAAEIIRRVLPETEIVTSNEQVDLRDYRVSFEKLRDILGVELNTSLEDGIRELCGAFESGKIQNFRDPVYYNVPQTEKTVLAVNGPDYVIGSASVAPRRTAKALLRDVPLKVYDGGK